MFGSALGCLTQLAELLHGLLWVWRCCSQMQLSEVLQVKLYMEILHSKRVAALCSGHGVNDASALSVINSLKKLCNMPDLLYSGQDGAQSVYLHSAGMPILCCFRNVSYWPLPGSPAGVHIACGLPYHSRAPAWLPNCFGSMSSAHSTCSFAFCLVHLSLIIQALEHLSPGLPARCMGLVSRLLIYCTAMHAVRAGTKPAQELAPDSFPTDYQPGLANQSGARFDRVCRRLQLPLNCCSMQQKGYACSFTHSSLLMQESWLAWMPCCAAFSRVQTGLW